MINPLPRDTDVARASSPPAQLELQRLVAYHRDLSCMTCTYTGNERALHRRVAALLDRCDPATWTDEWHGQPATVIRARIIVRITAAMASSDDLDVDACLDAARTIIATTGAIPTTKAS